jgi:hypothetical protein
MLQPGADLTTESKTPIYNNICLIEMSRPMSSGKVRLLHANKWYQTKLIRSVLKVDSILRHVHGINAIHRRAVACRRIHAGVIIYRLQHDDSLSMPRCLDCQGQLQVSTG